MRSDMDDASGMASIFGNHGKLTSYTDPASPPMLVGKRNSQVYSCAVVLERFERQNAAQL